MSAGILDMRRMPPRAVPPPPPSASAAAAAAALPHVPPHQTPVAIPVADHPGGLSLPHENADCDTTRKWIIDLLVHPDNGYSEEEAKATADKHRGRFRVMTILTLEKKQSLFGILEGAIIHEAVTRKVEDLPSAPQEQSSPPKFTPTLLPPPQLRYPSREALLQAARSFAARNGYAITIERSHTRSAARGRVWLKCDRGGRYRNQHNITDETRIRKGGSRLTNCPFKCVGAEDEERSWVLMVENPHHNHEPSIRPEDHPVNRRMDDSTLRQVVEMTNSGMTPRDIISTLRRTNPELTIINRDIYNARKKLKAHELKFTTDRASASSTSSVPTTTDPTMTAAAAAAAAAGPPQHHPQQPQHPHPAQQHHHSHQPQPQPPPQLRGPTGPAPPAHMAQALHSMAAHPAAQYPSVALGQGVSFSPQV